VFIENKSMNQRRRSQDKAVRNFYASSSSSAYFLLGLVFRSTTGEVVDSAPKLPRSMIFFYKTKSEGDVIAIEPNVNEFFF
jgi:hypothetical protein